MSAVPARGHMPFPGHRTQEQVPLMKERGLLSMHRREEQELLTKLESEALLPSRLG